MSPSTAAPIAPGPVSATGLAPAPDPLADRRAPWPASLRSWLTVLVQAEEAGPCPDLGLPALDQLAAQFALGPGDRLVLALLFAREIDPACAGLIQDLCVRGGGRPWIHAAALWERLGESVSPERFAPTAPLRHWRLVELGGAPEPGLPWGAQPLRLDERILFFLLGQSRMLDARLAPFFQPPSPSVPLTPSQVALAEHLAELWNRAPGFLEFPVIELRGHDPAAARALAWQAARHAGFAVMELAASALPADRAERHELARLWQREALLGRAVLYLDCTALSGESTGPVPSAPAQLPEAVRHWIQLSAGGLVLATTPRTAPLAAAISLPIPPPSFEEKRDLVEAFSEVRGRDAASLASRVAMQFELGAGALFAACRSAIVRQAETAAGTPDPAAFERALWQACREEARPRLGALVERIESRVTWDDLVLPATQMTLLREAALQVRHRARVYQEWGFAAKSARGLNITALFSGPSGSGKTLAAEVIANDLELDLLRIDLSATVSKYIGETEANLREIFDAAEAGGAVLLFDEADALFGRRSEVKDSHDRHANMEVCYLLQRLETYRGLAILTTNFREVIDPAFLRRLRFLVEFPFPDQVTRRRLWQGAFPPQTPVHGLDFDRLGRLSLTGGNIRNIAVNAAFLAAAEAAPVGMRHVQRAAEAEFAKIDKPTPKVDLRAFQTPRRETP